MDSGLVLNIRNWLEEVAKAENITNRAHYKFNR